MPLFPVKVVVFLGIFLIVTAKQTIESEVQDNSPSDPSLVHTRSVPDDENDDLNRAEICDPNEPHPCKSTSLLCMWDQLELTYKCTHLNQIKRNIRQLKDKQKQRAMRKYVYDAIRAKPKSASDTEEATTRDLPTTSSTTTKLKEIVKKHRTYTHTELTSKSGVNVSDQSKRKSMNAARTELPMGYNRTVTGPDNETEPQVKDVTLNLKHTGDLRQFKMAAPPNGKNDENKLAEQPSKQADTIPSSSIKRQTVNRPPETLPKLTAENRRGRGGSRRAKGRQANDDEETESPLDKEDTGPANGTIPEYSGTLTWDGETEFSTICKTTLEMQDTIGSDKTSYQRKLDWNEAYRDEICDFKKFFFCVVVDEDLSLIHVANYSLLEQQKEIELDEPVCRCYDSAMAVVNDRCYIPADAGVKSDCGPHVFAPYPIKPWEGAPPLKPKCTPNSECRESLYWFGRRCSCKQGYEWNSDRNTCGRASSRMQASSNLLVLCLTIIFLNFQ